MDGLHEPAARYERVLYSYCHGVTIGLETELAQRTRDRESRRRATALVAAVRSGAVTAGVINGSGGGGRGLFMGILARYLAGAAVAFRDSVAAGIVHASAQAAWDHRGEIAGLPLLGPDCSRPALANPVPPHTNPRKYGAGSGIKDVLVSR